MRVGSSLSIRKKVDVIPVVSLPTRVVISYLQTGVRVPLFYLGSIADWVGDFE